MDLRGKLTIGGLLSVIKNLILWSLFAVLLLITTIFLGLQLPAIQNILAKNLVQRLNDRTASKIELSQIKISWLDALELKGLQIYDYQGDTMLFADLIHVDFDLLDIIAKKELNFDQVEISNGSLLIRNYHDSLNINLVEFIAEIKGLLPPPSPQTENKVKKQPPFMVDHIYLDGFEFGYANDLKERMNPPLFDYGHFRLNITQGVVDGFVLQGDSIHALINSLSCFDPVTDLAVKEMSGEMALSGKGLILNDLELNTKYSTIRESIELKWNGYDDLAYFIDSVYMNFSLRNTHIHPRDLSRFAQLGFDLPPIGFSGKVRGKVGHLSIDQMELKISNETFVNGSVDFLGLPNTAETFIDLVVTKGQVRPKQLHGIIGELPTQIKELGAVSFSGHFSGFVNDFVAKADIRTGKGRVVSDLNLKFPSGIEQAQYSGRLKISNFSAGAFIGDREMLQTLNFNGFIKGKGLTVANANFYTEAELINTGIYGYNYESIKAKGRFASKFFDGSLEIRDPNASLKSSGTIDLRQTPEQINIQSLVENIDFRALGFSEDYLTLKADIDFQLLGLSLDSIDSDAKIRNLNIVRNDDQLSVDSILFSTKNVDGMRYAELLLPEVEAHLLGNFYYSQIVDDLKSLRSDFVSYFDPTKEVDSLKIVDYERYQIDFDMNYRDINAYLNFLTNDLYVSPGGQVEGSYRQRRNATLTAFSEIDSVYFKGAGFKGNVFELNVSKDLDSEDIIAMAYLFSERQDWKRIPATSDLNLEVVWQDSLLTTNMKFDQPETNSRAIVNTELAFLEDRLRLHFSPSTLEVLDGVWKFNPHNNIEFFGDRIVIEDLELVQDNQRILLEGVFDEDRDTKLDLTLGSFEVANLNTVFPIHLQGQLSGSVNVEKLMEDLSYHFESDISIDEFYFENYYVGDIVGRTHWQPVLSELEVDFDIHREGINTIDLSGYYDPSDADNSLNLTLDFTQASLRLAGPFAEPLITGLSGLADGAVKISGTPNNPVILGNASIQEGRFTYGYLGISCAFAGELEFNNNFIDIKNFNLIDRDNNTASVFGKINHQGFKQINTDIQLNTDRFLFLNTGFTSGEIYFGTAYAAGNVKVTGPLNDLLISTDVRSEKGTKLYILLEDEKSVEQKEYITFVNFSDTTTSRNVQEVVKNALSGVRLDFDMELTPEAYMELIFNKRTGDIIRGSAAGNIKLVLDTYGDFEMFGDVSIVEGAYNFTSSISGKTLISKEFNIEPGGTISWYGDPYGGVLNLNAIYRQRASLSDLSVTTNGAEKISRIPVLVVLNLTGPMLSPVIGFEIKLEDEQSLASNQDKALINQINSNEQELKRQVFSLLMLGNFSQMNGSLAIAGGTVSSLSEFVTNQLSYYASQFNENLEIDLDLATMDDKALENLQFRLSYTFLEGRLKVTGGGGFNQTTAEEGQPSDNSFVGDWSVRYLLTPDGRLRVRAFSQSDRFAGVQQRETGVSVQTIKSFDDLRELLPKAWTEARRKRREEKLKEYSARDQDS